MSKSVLSNNKGFSLIEVLISISIMSISSSVMLTSFMSQVQTVNDSVVKSASIYAAQRVLDEIRTESIDALPSTGSDDAVSVAVDGKSYSVVVTYCIDSSYCSTNARHITVDVSYNGTSVYDVETVYTTFES